MTKLSKFLFIWLGVLLILAACSAESDLTTESTNNVEGDMEIVMTETATSASSAQAVLPATDQPPDTPTAQPTVTQSTITQPPKADFPNLGPAPEIKNEVWLNADEPITLASQRGKVVLVEFWTFG